MIKNWLRKRLKKGSHILIVCDSCGNPNHPNGVKTTIDNLVKQLSNHGYKSSVIHPHNKQSNRDVFKRIKVPFYPQFEVPINPFFPTLQAIRSIKPDAIFNTTPEGPLGFSSNLACKLIPIFYPKEATEVPYTISYTTNLDEHLDLYLKKVSHDLLSLPYNITQGLTQQLYKNAYKVLTPTKTARHKLITLGMKNTALWTRAVDTDLFCPLQSNEVNIYNQYKWFQKKPLPIIISVGRIAVEKNWPAFLKGNLENYHRVVVGSGPLLAELKSKYKQNNIHFLGAKTGEDLAMHLRCADYFVLTSNTETFGNVLLEALASGLPVIAYNVQGPKDVFSYRGANRVAILQDVNNDIFANLHKAQAINKQACVKYVKKHYSLKKFTKIFLKNLKAIKWHNK